VNEHIWVGEASLARDNAIELALVRDDLARGREAHLAAAVLWLILELARMYLKLHRALRGEASQYTVTIYLDIGLLENLLVMSGKESPFASASNALVSSSSISTSRSRSGESGHA